MTDVEKNGATPPSGEASNLNLRSHPTNEGASAYSNQHLIHRALTPGGHPLDTSQPALPGYHRKIGDFLPLGLFAFATSCFTLSWYNTGIRGISHPNVAVALCIGFGGIAQFLAGIIGFVVGNTFGATVFSAYSMFWLGVGIIYWPSSGILTAEYEPGELGSALGLFFMAWMVFTGLLFPVTLKASIGISAILFFLFFTFMLLGIAQFHNSIPIQKAAGAFGLITAFIAMYVGVAGLYTEDASYFTLPVGDLSQRRSKVKAP